MTTAREIARWRLRSQRLVEPRAASAVEVVRGLLGVQAENPAQSAWAVASRTQQPDPADLEAALADGSVLRTHVLRSTWHYVTAEDIVWLQELTAPRLRHLFLDQLGWEDAERERGRAALVDTLTEQPDQPRAQVAAGLAQRGVPVEGHALAMMLGLAELDGVVCSGRPVGGTHTYTLLADRVRNQRRLDRDEALAEIALRYFTGHGPATERDLAYWATLTVTDVRRGLAQVRDRLASFEHDGRTFWHAPGEEPPAGPLEPVGHLLQILDEMYRGYQDSRMVLDAEGVVAPGREASTGMALVDGQLVAGMRRTVGRQGGRRGGRTLSFALTPHRGSLHDGERAALEQAARRYAAFLGLEADVTVSA